MEKISVENYVAGLMEAENREEYVKSHIIDNYLPFETKCAICDNIIKTTCYDKIGEGENTITFFKINSRMRYMFFILELVRNYTDIEISFRDGKHLIAYNELCKNNVIADILDEISKAEIDEMNSILGMTLDDTIENERSFAGYLDGKFTGLGAFMESGLGVLNQLVSKFASDDAFVDKLKNKIDKSIK